ncbi:MAG: hypothetical protein ISR34_02455 [Pirellulales bacterium]|nr:hypothetical protein [Pirellulales bacterium]
MIVLLPESIWLSPFMNDLQALKIVSMVACQQIKQVHKWRSKNEIKGRPRTQAEVLNEWANIWSKNLKKVTPTYKTKIDELVDKNILERNPIYSNFKGKKFPKSFRFHENLSTDNLFLMQIKQRKKPRRHRRKTGAFSSYHEAAMSWIDCFDLPEKFLQEYETICEESTWPDYERLQIVELNNKSWWHTVDKFGRYHTPLTNMNKKLRMFLCCKGSGIVGFDFANFQPALLEHFPTNSIAIQIPDREREHYKTLCKTGTIYQYMLEQTSHRTKAKAKEEFLAMLNKPNNSMKKMEMWTAFDRNFPHYSKVIQEIKVGSGKDPHKQMASFLMSKESQIIFGHVVKNFQEMTSDSIPFFTIHDAVYTIKNSKKLLKQSMEKAITNCKISTFCKGEEGSTTCYPSQPTNVAMKPEQNLWLTF